MNARAAVVGFMLAGFGVLALASMTPIAHSTVRTMDHMQTEVVPEYAFPRRREQSTPSTSIAITLISEGWPRGQ
jgi:hypothetical protein